MQGLVLLRFVDIIQNCFKIGSWLLEDALIDLGVDSVFKLRRTVTPIGLIDLYAETFVNFHIKALSHLVCVTHYSRILVKNYDAFVKPVQ